MKRILSILLAIGAAAFSVMADTHITSFKCAPPVTLYPPDVPNSMEMDLTELHMMARKDLPLRFLRATEGWTTLTTDDYGMLALPKATEHPLLYTLATRIRAPRFSKGVLKVFSNVRNDIFVNGKYIANISAPKIQLAYTLNELEITLNPEADNEIQINILSMPEDFVAPEFTLEYIPNEEFEEIAVEEGADIPRRFSILGAMLGEKVSQTSISPDGKYMIVNYIDISSKNDTISRAELIETQTGKLLTGDLNPLARWMPKGSKIYYPSLYYKTERGYTVYSMEVPSMKSEAIAHDIPNPAFFITPDLRYIIYYQQVAGEKDEGPAKRLLSPNDRMPNDRDRNYLVRYDLETGVANYLTYGGFSTEPCDISADGRYILYSSLEVIPSEYPMMFTDIIQMDLTTFETDTIFRHDGYINSAIYSPDAKQLFVCGSPQAFDGIGLAAGNHPIPNAFDIQGYIYTIADKKVIPVTKDFNPSIDTESEIFWNRADGNIYFRATEGFSVNLYCLNPKNLVISKIPTETMVVKNFSIGIYDDTRLAYTGEDFYNTDAAYLLNLKTGKSRLVADPMKPELADIEFGKMEEWNFTSSDGTEINGYFCLPPGFDPSKKYPLIVYYYGGTAPTTASISDFFSPQVLASRDYVVYILNPSGAYGYGQEFSARHVNTWGKRTAEDIIEGVKEFCKAHPFVNDKKIGCCGASHGGFMTQYILTLTDIFAAAVSHAGISNVASYWGEGYWGYSVNSISAAKSFPWNNPDLFTKQGSLFNADKIHTPLLLLHGTADTNVPIGESIQLFNALRILDRTVELVTFENENHTIMDFDKTLIWHDSFMAWFAKYLQDDPSWWDELYGK